MPGDMHSYSLVPRPGSPQPIKFKTGPWEGTIIVMHSLSVQLRTGSLLFTRAAAVQSIAVPFENSVKRVLRKFAYSAKIPLRMFCVSLRTEAGSLNMRVRYVS